MPQPESEGSFKIVEVIELTGPVDRVVCLIGTWPPASKVVRMETYRGEMLVNEEEHGFGPTLPLAELICDLEDAFRRDAHATGNGIDIYEILAPFGREQFDELLATRWPASQS